MAPDNLTQDSLRLPGPYFGFLVANRDEYLERRGKVQRVVGIKREFHQHPGMLRVSDSLVSLFLDCFKTTGRQFAYYGYTEYELDALDQLSDRLAARLASVTTADEKMVVDWLKGSLLEANLAYDHLTPAWQDVRGALAAALSQILARARQAQRDGRVLLVLGV